jgi:hypothetical protein
MKLTPAQITEVRLCADLLSHACHILLKSTGSEYSMNQISMEARRIAEIVIPQDLKGLANG